MNAIEAIAHARRVRAAAKRAVTVAERCGSHLQNALGPRLLAAFREDACKDVRADLTRAVAGLATQMEVFDGSPDQVVALSKAGDVYLRAYLAALEKARDVAGADSGVDSPSAPSPT